MQRIYNGDEIVMAKSNLVVENTKLFNIKEFGKGCRFGININSQKQDKSGYTKGVFINCKHSQMLSAGQNYTLSGFLGDNEYNGNNTLEFIVMTATPQGIPQSKPSAPKQPEIDISDDELPF
jgi:hypothetical protein